MAEPLEQTNSSERTVWIVGASARAATESATEAGYRVWACDRFCDEDLRESAEVVLRIQDYPEGLKSVLDQLPEIPWLYTGALENRPQLVDSLAKQRELLGNSGSVLRRIRSPWTWPESLSGTGLKVLKHCREIPDSVNPRQWLEKPVRSCGGTDIRFSQTQRARRGFYFQEYIEGISYSAVCLGNASEANVLGITRQWTGLKESGAGPFSYSGSIGPVSDLTQWRHPLKLAATNLTREFQLRGLFGLDLILADGQLSIVEINPRYPASTEILERSGMPSAIGLHIGACKNNDLSATATNTAKCQTGKLIFYADNPIRGLIWRKFLDQQSQPQGVQLADRPSSDDVVQPGSPLLTLIAQDRDADSVTDHLFAVSMKLREFIQRTAKSD